MFRRALVFLSTGRNTHGGASECAATFRLCAARGDVSTKCSNREAAAAEAEARELTWDGAQVEVVSYDLLQLVVQRALLKLQTEVVAQVRVQHFTCNGKREEVVSERIAGAPVG